MIAGTLGFPFSLAARKIVSTLFLVIVLAALVAGLDLSFAAAGADLLSEQANVFPIQERAARISSTISSSRL